MAPPDEIRTGWVRSYLADGRMVRWQPPAGAGRRWAIDAEIADQPVPPALAGRTGIDDPAEFWPRWTAVEVAAKLLDIPVVMWISQYGLDPRPAAEAGVIGQTTSHLDLVISVGARPTRPGTL